MILIMERRLKIFPQLYSTGNLIIRKLSTQVRIIGENFFLTFITSTLGKRDYESLAKFIETGDFEEYVETESDFNDDDYGLQFEDLDNEKENAEKKEESDEEADVIDETEEKKHDEL